MHVAHKRRSERAPVITADGANPLRLHAADVTDPGASAVDPEDAPLQSAPIAAV